MYYISCKNNDEYGICDTKDDITEFYSAEQIKEIAYRGIKIKGFLFELDGYSIRVLNKEKHSYGKKTFYKTNFLPNINKSVSMKSKIAGQNDFQDIFKDIPFRGYNMDNYNYPRLVLSKVDFSNKELYFCIAHDHRCNLNTMNTKEIIECWNNTIFKNRTELFLRPNSFVCWNREFLGLKLTLDEFIYFVSLISSFFRNFNESLLRDLPKNKETEVMDNIYIYPSYIKTKIGVTVCYDLYVYLDIYKIPVILMAREDSFFDSNEQDCRIYYKNIEGMVKNGFK